MHLRTVVCQKAPLGLKQHQTVKKNQACGLAIVKLHRSQLLKVFWVDLIACLGQTNTALLSSRKIVTGF